MDLIYHDEIRTFIKTLEKSTQSKVVRGIELIEQYGQNLGMPHVKKVSARLYELIIKKTQKTPQREIETAGKRLLMLTSI